MVRHGKLVLIVDRDLDFVEDLRVLLRDHRVLSARSIMEASEIVVGGRVDAVVLGPSFGSEAGVRSAAELLDADRDLAIVLVANIVTNRVLRAALQLGLLDVVDTPVTLRKLADALGRAGSRQPAAADTPSAPRVDHVSHAVATPPIPAVAEPERPVAPRAVEGVELVFGGAAIDGRVLEFAGTWPVEEPAPAPEPAAAVAPAPVPEPVVMDAPVHPVPEPAVPEMPVPPAAPVPVAPVPVDLRIDGPDPVADVPMAAPPAAPVVPVVTPVAEAPPVAPSVPLEPVTPPAQPVMEGLPAVPPMAPPVPPGPPPSAAPSDVPGAPPMPAAAPPTTVTPVTIPPAPVAGRHSVAVERPAARPLSGNGEVIAVTAGKAGSGKTVTATNLAAAMTERLGPDRVVIVDADMQFGDVALLLQLDPVRTVVDAAEGVAGMSDGRLDSMLLRHESGLRVLPAPLLPIPPESAPIAGLIAVIERLKRMYDVVVVDTSPIFGPTLLSILDHADTVLMVVDMDLPSVKNAKIAIDTLRSDGYPAERVNLVVNRVNSKARLDLVELERSLGLRVSGSIPSDRIVPQSVNEGIPAVLLSPRSRVAKSFHSLAERFGPERARRAS